MPKALRAFLATAEQVNLLVLSLKVLSDPNVESDGLLSLDHDLDCMPEIAWSGGVEEYKDTPPDDLWAML